MEAFTFFWDSVSEAVGLPGTLESIDAPLPTSDDEEEQRAPSPGSSVASSSKGSNAGRSLSKPTAKLCTQAHMGKVTRGLWQHVPVLGAARHQS